MTSKLKKALLLGGKKSELPAGYTRLAYLETTQTQYIELPYYIQDGLGAECEYIDRLANNDTPVLSCIRRVDNNRFFSPYVYNGDVYYGWDYFYRFERNDININLRTYSSLNYRNNRKWSFRQGDIAMAGNLSRTLETATYGKLQLMSYFGYNVRRYILGSVFYANVSLGENVVMKLVPCVDSIGSPCMYDTVTKQTFYNKGTGDFVAGIETLAQLYSLLAKLPDLTGQEQKTLTIRLAAALQTDELRALIDAQAEAKNWEITEAA